MPPHSTAAEELAEQERQRLEALEAQRLRRQRGEVSESEGEEEAEEAGAGEGQGEGRRRQQQGQEAVAGGRGYAARRAKRRREEAGLGSEDEEEEARGRRGLSGDALEDDFALEGGSDEEGEGDGAPDEGESWQEGRPGVLQCRVAVDAWEGWCRWQEGVVAVAARGW